MNISGFIKQSLMDYPGKISSVVFTQGCNFCCPYCHNSGLIPFVEGSVPETEVLHYLERNRLLLDGVVITGGEPTMQPLLLEFVKEIKILGLAIKLDTNGTNPKLVKELIDQKLVDYIAMDIKSALNSQCYAFVAGVPVKKFLVQKVKQTMDLIMGSGIEHEFRTTICKELVTFDDIKSILNEIKDSQQYYLQQYKSPETDKGKGPVFTSYEDASVLKFIVEQNNGIKIDLRN